MLTKAEAACFISNLPITADNKEKALNIFQQAGMEPVHLSNGDIMSPVAMGVEKVIREPWKYKKYDLSHINETEDNDYYTAPTSRKAILDLLKIIFPSTTYNTTAVFFDENEVFSILSKYLPPKYDLTPEKINYWMGQDKFFPTRRRRQINKLRKSGRDLNLLDEKLRDFTWEAISNIEEFRKFVQNSADKWLTLGYARKSRSEKKKDAVEQSLNLQSFKLKKKLLCGEVYCSHSNANENIEDRDLREEELDVDSNGNTQDMVHHISSTEKCVRIVFIDFAGLSTSADNVREFLELRKITRTHKLVHLQ